MTRIGVVTQARMTSTRLPGKILLQAGGDSMLGHHVRRLAEAGLSVYLATTTNPADDAIASFADERGVPVHRGSEHDVLGRYVGAVRQFDLDVVVRVTSDCPLIDGDLVRRGLDEFLSLGDFGVYLSNVLVRTYPRGFDFEVFSAAALLEADANAREPFEREHVTPYINRNVSGAARIHHFTRRVSAERYRLTLDTPDDWTLLRALIEEYGAHQLSGEAIIEVLERHPELAATNAHVEQKKLGD